MIYRFEDCELNTDVYTFSHAGKPLRLEPKVFDLLVYLIENRDRVVSKDELLERLWPNYNVSEATLSSSIMTARRAVGDSGSQQRVIKTLRRGALGDSYTP
ncbi:winged helix-turn-helix domain-containing protein [Candidatus Entotheonella palauensis]|uniref:winged helix-turn-helix domain-containing protein n=1 Tax=Candidatus Entotheonella palauensis TaxID=93172 RepID=UPI000B7FA21A|nr:winged helix-turn-helix domain-containing protein [Candidatus Entotheonella palauensis]